MRKTVKKREKRRLGKVDHICEIRNTLGLNGHKVGLAL